MIPESFNRLSVKHFGRQETIEIVTNNWSKFDHYGNCTNIAILYLIYFCRVGFSYFNENEINMKKFKCLIVIYIFL